MCTATTLSCNIAVGYNVMSGGVGTGSNNIAMGTNSSDALTCGNNNIALGQSSLRGATTGCQNIAIGRVPSVFCRVLSDSSQLQIIRAGDAI